VVALEDPPERLSVGVLDLFPPVVDLRKH
jgi:hypothetical protein